MSIFVNRLVARFISFPKEVHSVGFVFGSAIGSYTSMRALDRLSFENTIPLNDLEIVLVAATAVIGGGIIGGMLYPVTIPIYVAARTVTIRSSKKE